MATSKVASKTAPREIARAVAAPAIAAPRGAPPAPNTARLDPNTAAAVRSLYGLASRPGVTVADVEAYSALRLRPYVGQYKAEVLAWLRGQA